MDNKRTILFLLFCTIVMPVVGQKLSEVLHHADEMSPQVAIYYLRDMQQLFTDEPRIYAKMGDIAYQQIDGKDPITDYQERKNLLYSARLYYGNCLHFAKERSDYPILPTRIKEIKVKEQETDSLYERFNRLVSNYNQCVLLFTKLMDNHKREKMAHLLFSKQDSLLVDSLLLISSKLPQYITEYQELQTWRDVHFRWLPIELYRLDGLTYSNFLESDIALWDYYQWAEQFIATQHSVYDALYQEMQTDSISERLLNQLQQVDYGSAIHDWFVVRKQKQQQNQAWEMIAKVDSIDTNETMMHLLLHAYSQQAELQESLHALQLHLQKMDEKTFMRYIPFFHSQHINSVAEVKHLAQADYNHAAMLQKQFGTRLIHLGKAYIQRKTEDQRAEEGFIILGQDEVLAMAVSGSEIAILLEQDGGSIVQIKTICQDMLQGNIH